MRNARKLALKREALTQLTTDEMSSVNGGTHFCTITDYCTDQLTHGTSLDQICPSNPITGCVPYITNVYTVC